MSATFDATTKAVYDAATTAQARAEAIVASLTGTITVTVYNGSNAAMGTGTMAAPWATAANGIVTLGEVSSFTVGTTATPDADWYIRFENSDASRWVRGSFGLADSGQDYTWSLATWTATQTGTIGTATIIASGNSAPAFTVAPTTASIAATGGTIQFTAVDPEGSEVVYSITTTRAGITINASTGLVTVTAAAAGTSGNIVVQASDGILTASATCAVTVASASTIGADYDAPFEVNISPFFQSKTSGATVAVDTAHSREGSGSLLVYLPDPTQWRAEVELGWGGLAPYDHATWYGWSVYVPSDWTSYFATWEVFPAQWHQRIERILNPPMNFETGGNRTPSSYLHFRYGWANNPNATAFEGQQIHALCTIDSMKGHWTDFVMMARWSTTGSGQLRLWMNGTEVVTRLNAPNYIYDENESGQQCGPYWKLGIYNGWRYGDSTPGVTFRRAWIDACRQINDPNAAYADAAPRGDRLESI